MSNLNNLLWIWFQFKGLITAVAHTFGINLSILMFTFSSFCSTLGMITVITHTLCIVFLVFMRAWNVCISVLSSCYCVFIFQIYNSFTVVWLSILFLACFFSFTFSLFRFCVSIIVYGNSFLPELPINFILNAIYKRLEYNTLTNLITVLLK
jgi:hypothetical protein